jgi:hypothetical protein
VTLKKAMIIVHRGMKKDNVEVLFNPSEYSLDTSNSYTWKTARGMTMPVGQFVSGGATSLTMDFFFDTYEQGVDVRNYTVKIASLLDVEKKEPPICQFVWGSLDFKGVVEKVAQNFTMFLNSGIPVRAKLKVTFRSWLSQMEQLRTIEGVTAEHTKQRMLKQGDQLWMIAAHEYEDPSKWREIAKVNKIDNPLKVQTGRRISVPRLN